MAISIPVTSVQKSSTGDLFVWTIIKRSVGLLAMIIGMCLWNVKGLLWGMVFGSWFLMFSNAYLVSKHVGYKLFHQIKDLLPLSFVSLLAFFLTYIISFFLVCDVYIESLIVVLVYLVIYLCFSYFLKIRSLDYCFEFIKTYRK